MTEVSVERFHSTDAPRRGSNIVAADQLKSIIARIEKLEEERSGIAADIRDLYAESKGAGFHIPTLRKVIKLRAMDAAERDEAEQLLDTYCAALGMKPQLDMFEGE